MSFRLVLLLAFGIFIAVFSSVLFRGEVIFPHDNAQELGSPSAASARISNRKFSDESSAFIPELANNLRTNHRTWLSTWNPHVELGRPALHVGGLSRASALTHLLSCFSTTPFILYSALVLVTVGLTILFAMLFFRALGLHPVAGAFSSLGLGLTTATMYWLTFVVFLSTICWSMCLLWLITASTRRSSWGGAIGIAFASYCLLLTGYPQMTILFAAMIGCFALIRILEKEGSKRSRLRVALTLLGAAAVGVLAVLPVYLDLAAQAQNSARLRGVSDSFFLAVLPTHHGWGNMAGFLTSVFDWSWLGNAIAPAFPMAFNGLSFTPVFGSLAWLSFFLLKSRRDWWFWQIFLLVCVAGTIFPALYLFAVHHLGLGFSRLQLLCGALIPGFALCAYMADAILRGEFRLTMASVVWLLLPSLGEAVVALTAWRCLELSLFAIAATIALVLGLFAAIRHRSISGFLALAVASIFLYGRPLILSRPLSAIHRSSGLTIALKEQIHNARFAIADPAIKEEFPPNQEALLNLKSINTYDSLAPMRYQELVRAWSALGADTYGRHFKTIDLTKALQNAAFRLADVSLILSKRPLPMLGLDQIAEVHGIRLYRPPTPPISVLQTRSFKSSGQDEMELDLPSNDGELASKRIQNLDDLQDIHVTASPTETLLFVSQQYHRAWRATADGQRLRTVRVNHFYQGVILPPRTTEVVLSFRPFVLWSWLPQLFFAVATVLLLSRALLKIIRDKVSQPA